MLIPVNIADAAIITRTRRYCAPQINTAKLPSEKCIAGSAVRDENSLLIRAPRIAKIKARGEWKMGNHRDFPFGSLGYLVRNDHRDSDIEILLQIHTTRPCEPFAR